MASNKVILFGIPVDALSMYETVTIVDQAIKNKQQIVQNSINANKVVLMEKDQELRKSLLEADMISADGQAIVWSANILRRPLPERVPGIDLMDNLINLAGENHYKVFLLGAKEDIVLKVANYYNSLFENKIVIGYRNGYYKAEDEPGIIDTIHKSGAQMLFLAIPSPAKELFLNKYRHKLPNVYFLMGVGGSFDVISGNIARAPEWMQKFGLEWLYRLIQEPRKMWRRYLIGNISFLILLLKEKTKIGQ